MSSKTNFLVDIQTLYDLDVFSENDNGQSIFKLLNFTRTPGGTDKLKSLLRKPFNSKEKIIENQRSILFFLSNKELRNIPVTKEMMDVLEMYFFSKNMPITSENGFSRFFEVLFLKVKGWKKQQETIQGAQNTLIFFKQIRSYLLNFDTTISSGKIKLVHDSMLNLLNSEVFGQIWEKEIKSLSSNQLLAFDKKFRETEKSKISILFEHIYELDVSASLAIAHEKFKLSMPEFTEDSSSFDLKAFFHLFLEKPVKNNLILENNRLLFLTGPNMAGKTTMLKSVGLIICLAHAGIGIPAVSCKMPVFNGLFSSVNTADNLFKGYSYFYSEVLRVKAAAQFLKETEGKGFLIFDELFKGTNIKDAFDCSLEVVEGLVKWENSIVIVSSHLLELGKAIKKYNTVAYRYFESEVKNGKPYFNFNLTEGISDERLGLLILQNENISELLNPDK